MTPGGQHALGRPPRPAPIPIAAWLGLARSLLLYYAVPFKAQRLASLYRTFVRPGDLCFDLGAHVGDRTRALLGLGARVVAIEPHPLFAGFLARIFRGNPRVVVIPAAVGRSSGRSDLSISDRNPTVSSTSPRWIEQVRQAPRFAGVSWDGQVEVEVVHLDGLIARYGLPGFCKIDIEGSEHEALLGLSEALPALSFEYVPALRAESRACLDGLEALSRYEYNWSERETARLRSPAWLDRPAMAAVLDAMPDRAHSGDVYARLKADSRS